MKQQPPTAGATDERFTVVIADDEPLARLDLRSWIEDQTGWRLLAEAESGPAACQAIETHRPQVVFLDIRMPGQSGIDVARVIQGMDPRPLVVFATAFDDHALEAFEVEAVDYLLKPFDRERFAATVQRLERRLNKFFSEPSPTVSPAILSSPTSASSAPKPLEATTDDAQSVLAVRSVGRVRLVPVDQIHWIAAAGNYVRLYLDDACMLHRATLASMEKLLSDREFMRIHRSTLVHRRQVVEIRSVALDRSRVVLKDGTELDISQRFRKRVLQGLVP